MVSDKLKEVIDGLIEGFMTDFKEGFEQGLFTLRQLVFGTRDGLVWATFDPQNLTNGLNPIYYTMMVIAGFMLVIGVLAAGMRITSSGMNPQRRNEVFESSKDLLFIALLLFNLPLIYDLLFSINGSLVKIFSGSLESNLDNIMDSEADRETGVVAWVFIQLILLGLALWANFYYLMRKVTLIILMGLGPLMVAMWMFPQFKGLTGAWFKELVGSIFVQSIHAFVFWTIAIMSSTSSGFLETVILYVIFIPISESLRRLLNMGGDMQGGFAKAGAMMGLSGLAGMYGAAKGAFKDKSVMGALNEAYKGASNTSKGAQAGGEGVGSNKDLKDTVGSGAGADTGSTTRAEKMLKSGDFMSKGGKAVLGMAGSIAGTGLGPVGAMAGATIGSEVGGVAGGFVGRVGAAGAISVADRIQKGTAHAKAKMTDSLNPDNPKLGDEISDAIAQDKTANWASAHKEQVMSNLKDKFPDATPQQLENKFADIQSKKFNDYKKQASNEWKDAEAASENVGQSGEMVDNYAKGMANQWGIKNKAKFNKEYQQNQPQRPGESDQSFFNRQDKAFEGQKAQMEDTFRNAGMDIVQANKAVGSEIGQKEFGNQMTKALKQMPNIKNPEAIIAAGTAAIVNGKGKQMDTILKDSANAMTKSWEAENKDGFIEDYKKANPQKPKESDELYNSRANRAFNEKKAEMRNTFQEQAKDFGKSQANKSLVNSDAFKKNMKTALIQDYGMDADEADEITAIGQKTASHVTGKNLLAPNGVPDGKRVVQQLAYTKTQKAEAAYVKSLSGKSPSEQAEAITNWRATEAPKVHAQAVQELSKSGVADRVNAIPSIPTQPPSPLTQAAIGSTAFITGATGLRHIPKAKEVLGNTIAVGVQGFTSSKLENNNPVIALKDGFVASGQNIGTTVTAMRGGGVESYRKDQGNVAFIGGTLLGHRGHEMGAKLATKTSLFKGAASQEIHTPSEAIQMARTVIDENGNVRVAPGAIRQVIKPNESYIEVQTKSGDVQRVSRMSAGHSGLKKGDVVYQDLDVQDDMIVPARGKGGASGTYRLDSGGAKVPSDVQVQQNPNTLFNRPIGKKATNQFGQQAAPSLPIYNQRVDSGQFYVEDLKAQGLQNPQVVVEKGRQFVTAQKDGQTYRVSPIYSGDTRMNMDETVTIPVQVNNNKIQPTNVSGMENTIMTKQSKVRKPSSKTIVYDEVVDSPDHEYATSTRPQQMMAELLPSKHTERVKTSLERRKALDEGRRKQGLLG